MLPFFEFCFSKKQYQPWNKKIKKITRLLSKARDLDVQINFVENYLKTLDSAVDSTNLNTLLKKHKTHRKNIQTPVIQGLEELIASQTLTEIRRSCENLVVQQQTDEPFDFELVLQIAHYNINRKLADLLSLKRYVYLANKPRCHHQMRIYAKKLRYTLECFAPFYENRFKSEIQQIKTFQDTLGEIHDCDVWLNCLQEFNRKLYKKPVKTTKNPTESDKSLEIFATYILNKRKNSYQQFVECWTQSMKNGFFDQLTNQTRLSPSITSQKKTYHALTNPDVKIAVISDIHANLQALQKVIQDAQMRGAEIFVNAGDSVGLGACPNEVVELLSEKGILSIAGNYDVAMLKNHCDAKGPKKTTFKYTKKHLSKTSVHYLNLLPQKLQLKVADKHLLVVHGSPQSIDEHLYPHNTSQKKLQHIAKIAQVDIVVVGHSHIPFQREVDSTVFVNPGSVGRPGDKNPKTAYALLSFNPLKVELIRLSYDVEAAASDMRKEGLPESFAQMLLCGIPIDAVVKADKAKKAVLNLNCGAVVAACEKFSVALWPDTKHCHQVTNLALTLFDELAGIHKLGKRERCWLECAAVLHDVGLSNDRKKHHKTSMQLILNDTQLPLPSKERRIIASIARYHRGGLPNPKHYNLGSLDSQSMYVICVLAALLRLADSLDCRHESCVKLLSVKTSAKAVVVECQSKLDLLLELSRFNEKKGLFEKIFKKEIVLIWN